MEELFCLDPAREGKMRVGRLACCYERWRYEWCPSVASGIGLRRFLAFGALPCSSRSDVVRSGRIHGTDGSRAKGEEIAFCQSLY